MMVPEVPALRRGEGEGVSGISTRDGGERDVLIELSGEFDLHDLEDLRAALEGAASSERP